MLVVNPSKLGTWVDTQRVQYKKLQKKIAQLQHQKQMEASGQMAVDDNASVGSTGSTTGTPLVGRLTQERINRLQGLGFVWSLRDDWAKHYEELKGKLLDLVNHMICGLKVGTYKYSLSSLQRIARSMGIVMCPLDIRRIADLEFGCVVAVSLRFVRLAAISNPILSVI